MRPPLLRFAHVLVAVAMTAGMTQTAASSPDARAGSLAGKGVIKGSVKPPAASRRDVFRPTAYVARLDKPGALTPVTVSARGTFKAKVSAGLYAVVGSGYGRKAPRTDASVVLVRAGRTVRARELLGTRARAGTVRVSVGRFTPPAGADADAAYFSRGMSDLMINDLLHDLREVGDCQKDVRLYEDRKYGRFDEILKLLRLETTRYFDAETRSRAKAALRNLPKHAPTLRVMGSVSSVSETGATGTVRVVHVKSGKTLFSAAVSSAAPFDFSVQAAAAAARFLCESDVEVVPASLGGTFSGSVSTGSHVLTWSGTLNKEFVANDPHTGAAYVDSAHYRTSTATITWQVTGRCSGGGTLGVADLDTDFPDTTIDWRRTEPQGWAYELGLSPRYQTQAMLVPCPPTEDGPSPPYNAALLVGSGEGGALLHNSDVRGAETNRFSPDNVAFRGDLAINPGYAQTWTWDLTGSGEVPLPR